MTIKKFELNLLPGSVLCDHLDIPAARYDCEWNSTRQELTVERLGPGRKTRKVLPNISVDNLRAILLSHHHRLDNHFSNGEKRIIDSISRRGHKKSQSDNDIEDHHIIPMEVCKRSDLVIRATNLCHMDFDEPPNRLKLSNTFHRGSHPKYSGFVEWVLEDHWNIMEYEQRNDPYIIEVTITEVIDYFKDKLKEMESKGHCTINNVFL